MTDTRPEVTPRQYAWEELVAALPDASVTVELTEQEMTAAARDDTEGDTMRAELAAGKCQDSWRSRPYEYVRPDDLTVYRQHRCNREHGHRGYCRCRYCGQDRSAL